MCYIHCLQVTHLKVATGKYNYGTAFGEPSGLATTVEDISESLVENGFSYSGKDFLTSGITGEPLECYIFMGSVYYQRLKHMVQVSQHIHYHTSMMMSQ